MILQDNRLSAKFEAVPAYGSRQVDGSLVALLRATIARIARQRSECARQSAHSGSIKVRGEAGEQSLCYELLTGDKRRCDLPHRAITEQRIEDCAGSEDASIVGAEVLRRQVGIRVRSWQRIRRSQV